MSVSVDDLPSEDVETIRLLAGHPKFTSKLSAQIRNNGGVDRALRALDREFAVVRWKRVSATKIQVWLDAEPIPPTDGEYTLSRDMRGGWVFVENRDGELFVEDERCTLHAPRGVDSVRCIGYELSLPMGKFQTLHPNIAEALLENPHLIPERWNRCGRIFFWSVHFIETGNGSYARFIWGGSMWSSGFMSLTNVFGDTDKIVVIEV